MFEKDTPTSLEASENPTSANSISRDFRSSLRDMCLTFSAIAPTAWAAATLVSQFLLRRYWETYIVQEESLDLSLLTIS